MKGEGGLRLIAFDDVTCAPPRGVNPTTGLLLSCFQRCPPVPIESLSASWDPPLAIPKLPKSLGSLVEASPSAAESCCVVAVLESWKPQRPGRAMPPA